MEKKEKIVNIMKVYIDHVDVSKIESLEDFYDEIIKLIKENTNINNEEEIYIKEKIKKHIKSTLMENEKTNEVERFWKDHMDRKIIIL